jgi:hypothetical protein
MSPHVRPESSEWLKETIEKFVQSRTGGMIRELRVDVNERDVVLWGRTSTYYSKQLATHAALDATAHVSVTNEIEVC